MLLYVWPKFLCLHEFFSLVQQFINCFQVFTFGPVTVLRIRELDHRRLGSWNASGGQSGIGPAIQKKVDHLDVALVAGAMKSCVPISP